MSLQGAIVALMLLIRRWISTAPCSLPSAANYTCYAGFCGSDALGPARPQPPTCGQPCLAEIRFGAPIAAQTVHMAAAWCDRNSSCHGFAIDPTQRPATTLFFAQTNLSAAAQPNSAWSLFWAGAQPPPATPGAR